MQVPAGLRRDGSAQPLDGGKAAAGLGTPAREIALGRWIGNGNSNSFGFGPPARQALAEVRAVTAEG
ncbi:hypothetical protein ACF06W_28915 [Streptomyces albus]|uniref:hypothetical protein n=1 Tax=Streptomyces albus TaxID=1888 RepID=UPI0036FA1757